MIFMCVLQDIRKSAAEWSSPIENRRRRALADGARKRIRKNTNRPAFLLTET